MPHRQHDIALLERSGKKRDDIKVEVGKRLAKQSIEKRQDGLKHAYKSVSVCPFD